MILTMQPMESRKSSLLSEEAEADPDVDEFDPYGVNQEEYRNVGTSYDDQVHDLRVLKNRQ